MTVGPAWGWSRHSLRLKLKTAGVLGDWLAHCGSELLPRIADEEDQREWELEQEQMQRAKRRKQVL